MTTRRRGRVGAVQVETVLQLVIAGLLVAILAAIVVPGIDDTAARDVEVRKHAAYLAQAEVVEHVDAALGDPPDPQAAQIAAMRSNLTAVRAAIALYARRHDDTPPTEPVQMLLASTTHGRSPARDLGLYFDDGFPTNPLGDDARVRIVPTMPDAPVGDEGWIYALDDGSFRANVAGVTADGTPYFDF